MSSEKILALITSSEATKNELCSQLSSLLDGYMRVDGYSTETGITGKVKADLIVVSSKMMLAEAKEFLSEDSKVIIANRSLNMEYIDKLFHLPKGTKVMLVNDELENSIEVIRLLKEIGIDYLEYLPYAPKSRLQYDPGTVGIAITPGEVSLVPNYINKVIDIGPRVIDITTIIEILSILNLLDEKSRFISSKYMETIISLNLQLHDSIEEAESMNNYLFKVLDQVNDGIIAFNSNGIISVFNENCEEAFGIKASFAVRKNITQITRDRYLVDFLMDNNQIKDQLFKINGVDYIINKFRVEKMNSTVCTIKNTKDTIDMEKRLRQNLIKKGFVGKYNFSDIIGSSDIMRSTVETAKKLAKADLSILIYGESGVGKELFASAIHNESPRCSSTFLAVNFSSLSEDLAESELFGYEEGAFTGAKKGGKIGLFEQANGGTIFLDEIGDISHRVQARLLRVLQEKEIRRVGGTEIIPVNVRVIAATNKNLAEMCQSGLFREDLYHRLKKLYLKVPPLREHLDDIDELVENFIYKNGRKEITISQQVMTTLSNNKWSGNVRELENTIEYFLAVSESNFIDICHMPLDFHDIDKATKFDSAFYDNSLSKEGNLSEFICILQLIKNYNKDDLSISRKTISTEMKKDFPAQTENKVRHKMDILEESGLIAKRRGRGNVRITSLGQSYLSTK